MTEPASHPVFLAFLMTETNSFAPLPTGLVSFQETGLFRRDASLLDPGGVGAYLRPFRDLAEAEGHAVIESISAMAQPAGPTVQSVYEMLRDQLLDDLRAAGPVGMVLLGLHGAMIAEGYDDCEGDVIARVRAIVGPHVPIGVELDPHCHLTEAMVGSADAIVIMKEYPHTDWAERARELYTICARTAKAAVRPSSATFDCRMVGLFPTTIAPMAGFVQLLKDAESEPGILSVSLAHGFPWGDHPEMGAQVLVIADGDGARASATAERLGHAFYALRNQLLPVMPSIDAAIARAATLEGCIVMADTADNPGGGAPGDTTHLLRALLAAQLGTVAFGAICDAGAVRVCEEGGVGARLTLRLGGKLGISSGDPLDLDVEVMGLAANHHQTEHGQRVALGASAWVRARGIDILIVSIRSQIYSRDAFTLMGITLTGRRVVAVKSTEHFRADFAAIADHIIPIATPGALQLDFATLPFRHKRQLDYHPRTRDPLGQDR